MIDIFYELNFKVIKTTKYYNLKNYNLTVKYTNILKNINNFNFNNENFFYKNSENFLFIFKPKNQFFCNFYSNYFFSYSTGLILKAIGNLSRSNRRTKLGLITFLNFLVKKTHEINFSNQKLIVILKNLNNYNLIKKKFLKILLNSNCVLIKIGKNFSFKKYKKISYINKRMRRKYIIE